MIPEQEQVAIDAAKENKCAFITLYDQNFHCIYGFLLARGLNRETAEDLTSETFSLALKNIDRYVYTGKPFKAWLYRIAINEMNKHFKRQQRDKKILIMEKNHSEMTTEAADQELKRKEEEFVHGKNRAVLQDALKHLKPKEQDLISLRYFEDLSYKEIGDIMGMRLSHVGVKLNRTLKRLSKLCTFYPL
ncbi:MAG: RNA polymerase, sigma-E factor [uncultured bacterium]|nr:MAG: RNA polymerase, sigma-E factor [uncultured bacterium]KKT76302.1 MAG: RNA polymerase, sigma-24 subunit, ECF subfamily [Candidatus Peregrinibacteria bacterium GW2011_GWA2_44_7]